MAISEESRHQLHNRLDELLGPAEAATLMAHLPPIGWADVATKHDLAELERRMDMQYGETGRRFARIDEQFDAIDRRFDAVDRRFDRMDDKLEQIRRELRSNLMVSVATSAALLGAVVAAIKL